MNLEANRLNTFTSWPSSAPVDPIRIARAGFFYTGEGTEVECFSCGRKISEWNYGDQVMWRHRALNPTCAFVLSPVQSGNIALLLSRECNTPPGFRRSNEVQHDFDTQDYGLSGEDEMYKSDALRLLSFVNWDDSSVSRQELVNAGFYHAGGGRLRCAWCGGELAPFRNLGSLGPPLEVHRMYFPRCTHAAFLELERRNNEASSPSSSPSYTPPLQSPPTCASKPQSSGAAHNARVVEAGSDWRSLGVVGGGARHPSRAALAARLATFERWPADRAQAPRTLADAGFFYTGVDDQVRCFYCDGGLGKWKAGDAPWSEHAHWFPHCGYVLLIKGQNFIDTCRNRTSVQRTFSADRGLTSRTRNPGVNYSTTESQVEECMESNAALAALGAGLDAARVRRAIARRLRATGVPFSTSEGLIDAVLDEQLNEEAWSVSPHSQRLARDILAETLRDFAPRSGIIPSSAEDVRPEGSASQPDSPIPSPTPGSVPQTTNGTLDIATLPATSQTATGQGATGQGATGQGATGQGATGQGATGQGATGQGATGQGATGQGATGQGATGQGATSQAATSQSDKPGPSPSPMKTISNVSLEEENRQLKEARLCKVCMDNEVSVVFLPCGHLVSCAGCGAALGACPLCRATVKALVRAYLA
ncbi:death-associated inhibitor of apoptosis 2 isoform X2 [Pararge aegeria]|nr:death-associated inhibitor of apoptosis 2 isoform X2 [Pararge aegeria]